MSWISSRNHNSVPACERESNQSSVITARKVTERREIKTQGHTKKRRSRDSVDRRHLQTSSLPQIQKCIHDAKDTICKNEDSCVELNEGPRWRHKRRELCALLFFFFLLPLLNYPEAEKSSKETWWRVSAIIGIVAAFVPSLALISSPSVSSAFRRSNLPWHWQMNGEKMSNQMKNKYFILWIQRGEGWAAALCLVTIGFLFISPRCGAANKAALWFSAQCASTS